MADGRHAAGNAVQAMYRVYISCGLLNLVIAAITLGIGREPENDPLPGILLLSMLSIQLILKRDAPHPIGIVSPERS